MAIEGDNVSRTSPDVTEQPQDEASALHAMDEEQKVPEQVETFSNNVGKMIRVRFGHPNALEGILEEVYKEESGDWMFRVRREGSHLGVSLRVRNVVEVHWLGTAPEGFELPKKKPESAARPAPPPLKKHVFSSELTPESVFPSHNGEEESDTKPKDSKAATKARSDSKEATKAAPQKAAKSDAPVKKTESVAKRATSPAKGVSKKPVAKKTTSKKPLSKKSTSEKKATSKKSVSKKATSEKKATSKKSVSKKATSKKKVTKKTAVKKKAVRATASKKKITKTVAKKKVSKKKVSSVRATAARPAKKKATKKRVSKKKKAR